jgi:predicted ATPase/DNA-binding SARP family transcriptional activator
VEVGWGRRRDPAVRPCISDRLSPRYAHPGMEGTSAAQSPVTGGSGSGAPSVRVRLLGGFDVEVDGRLVPSSAWRLRKASELIRVLCLATGHRLHREQLIEQLWPDRPLDAALNNLHQAIYVARSALGSKEDAAQGILVLRDGFLSLCPEGDLWIDAETFEKAVRGAGSDSTLASLLKARELYRGEPLPDDRYADWAVGPRETLAQDYLSLLTRIAELEERDGRSDAAIDSLREVLELEPSDESAHRSLMRLYALGNRRQLALRQFEWLRTILARELEVEPSRESLELYHEILEGRFDSRAGTGADPSSGAESKLAAIDFGAPAAAPGRRDPAARRTESRHSHNLPIQLSSFIGREREVRQIVQLLEGAKALTLTGPGGTGKTRLGIEAAATLIGSRRDGVWLVELAAVSEPALVIQAIADVFDVREQQAESHLDLVIDYLAGRQVLLVLDNCEHLVDACATVAQAMLSACPDLKIVATSRQPLRIPGEVVFRVPSLPVPDPHSVPAPELLESIDSVRLFVERAQAVVPTFALTSDNAAVVARLCHHLDGLPLAIELAASRVASLPVTAILDRLDDRFSLLVGGSRTALSRQQTLKATLDWSYNLLTEPQRRMLRLLAAFVGGAPLDGVEFVCAAASVDAGDAVGLLGDLVDQSLVALDVAASEPRYHLLETVREYGHERLVELGESNAIEAAHASWALDIADLAQAAFPEPSWQVSLGRLDVEHDNVRAALDRSLSADPDRALALAAGLWEFWLWHGYLAEGRRWLGRALERSTAPSPARGRALVGLAALIIRSGETGLGARRAQDALATYRTLSDDRGACRAMQLLATAAWSEDDLGSAERHYRQSLELARATGYLPGQAAALYGLAVVHWYSGERRSAAVLINESLDLFLAADNAELAPTMLDIGEILVPQPETGSVRMTFQETFVPFQGVACGVAVGYALANRGMISRLAGDLDGARRDMSDALDRFRAIGDERAIAHALGRLGNLATASGEYARARELLEECLEIRRRIGDSRGTGLAQGNLGNLAMVEGDLARARSLLDESAAAFRRRGDMWGYSSALGNLASLAITTGDIGKARQWLEESLVAIQITGRDRWTAWALVQLAAVTRLDGDPERATSLSNKALEIFRRLGDRQGEAECLALGAAGVGRTRRASGRRPPTESRRPLR